MARKLWFESRGVLVRRVATLFLAPSRATGTLALRPEASLVNCTVVLVVAG